MKTETGQVIFILAVLLMILLLFLAVLIDGARLLIEQQEINRALDAAGKAGLIVAGDQMVTMAIAGQTAAASITPSATSTGSTPNPNPTATPQPDDFYGWLTDENLQTLVAPPMQTKVVTHALEFLEKNGLGLDNPDVTDIRVSYPGGTQSGDSTITVLLELDRRVVILFGRILAINQGTLSGKSKQTIPQ